MPEESIHPSQVTKESSIPHREKTVPVETLGQFRTEVDTLIKNAPGKITITSHMMPDDDAACSALAYKRILQKHYPDKEVAVVFSDKPIDAWNSFLTDPSEITWAKAKNGKTPEGKVRLGDIVDHVTTGDVLLCLDGGRFDRFSRVQEELENKREVKTVILDHHQGKPSSADVTYVEPESTSTCELLAKLYDPDSLSPEICQLLLAGILSDTQHFTIPGDHTETKELAGKLQQRSGKSYEEIEQMVTHNEQEEVYQDTFRKHISTYQKPNSPSQTYSFITNKEKKPLKETNNQEYDHFIARREFMREMVQKGGSDLYWTASPIGSYPASRYNLMFRQSPTSDIDLHKLAESYKGGGHTSAAAGVYELSSDLQKILQEKKNENKKFNETAYICNLIAEDIARRTSSTAEEKATVTSQSGHEPLEKIQQELKTYEPTKEEEPQHHVEKVPVQKNQSYFRKLYERALLYFSGGRKR